MAYRKKRKTLKKILLELCLHGKELGLSCLEEAYIHAPLEAPAIHFH